MKKYLILIFAFTTTFNSFGEPPVIYYVSKGFEQQGVNEYLQITHGTFVTYWTNHSKTLIELESEGNPYSLKVKFPNSHKVYKLVGIDKDILCIHPNGKKQVFNRIPQTFASYGFEQTGITEYIQEIEKDKFVYFTSQNLEKVIKLQTVSVQKTYPYAVKVKFPNQAQIYILEYQSTPCIRSLLHCIHPNKRVQKFTLQYWDRHLRK